MDPVSRLRLIPVAVRRKATYFQLTTLGRLRRHRVGGLIGLAIYTATRWLT